jgi:hypothetical protein
VMSAEAGRTVTSSVRRANAADRLARDMHSWVSTRI